MSIVLSLALMIQAPVAAAPGTPFGPATVIRQVGAGGLRDWRRDPARKDALFVRDRTERWYHVQLTGPCKSLRQNLDSLVYTTDPTGTFDRFSRLRLASVPQQNCGVQSIRRSTPPADAPVNRGKRR